MSDQIYWHFATIADDGKPRLGYNDGREVVVGETLTVGVEPELCERGLHASARLFDALGCSPTATLALCRVTLGGTVVHGNDKSAATERTCIAMLDEAATNKLLRDFARWCALQVIHLWDAPAVVRQYLETGDESLRAAARAAARATWDAAWAAARATWDAAWDAAWAAARATWAAAWDAAGDAAGDAARAAAGDAAWAAAGDAARAAAWDAKIAEFVAEFERRGLEAIAKGGE